MAAEQELGALLIRLGFDPSRLRDGLVAVNRLLNETGNNAQRTGSQLQGAANRGASSFAMLGRAAGAFGAVLLGAYAIRRFAQNVAESNAGINNLRKNLGSTAFEVSRLSNAAELAGGSKGGIQELLKTLSIEQTRYRLTGESGLIPFFNYLGMSLSKNIPAMKMFTELRSKLLDRAGGNRQEAFNIGQMMGIDEGSLNLMLKPDKEFNELMKKGGDAAVTNKEAEMAEKTARSFTQLDQSMNKFNLTLLNEISPSIIKLNEKIMEVTGSIGRFISKISEGRDLVGSAFDRIAGAINFAFDALTKGIISTIIGDFMKSKDGGDSFLPWEDLGESMDNIGKKIMEFLKSKAPENDGRGIIPGSPEFEKLFDVQKSIGSRINPTNNYNSGGNRTVQNSVGEIKIYTQSKDEANEIANRLEYLFAYQANTGLS